MSSRSPGRRRSLQPTLSRSSPLNTFPTVEDRVEISTENWARDIRGVYEHAKDRFGDVCWDSEAGDEEDRVWGHKAIVYARAPKAFKDRYFSSKPYARSPSAFSQGSLSPLPSPHLPPTTSASPHLLPPIPRIASTPVAGPSSYRRPSPNIPGRSSSLSTATAHSANTFRPFPSSTELVLRLTHGDTPSLFAAQLEWLYTGEGFGDVVEWISAEEGDTAGLGGTSVRDSLGRRGNQAERRDRLGQDLTYMWRSKLYADVRIHLDDYEPPDIASDGSGSAADSIDSAMVTAHRFILVSRSPYFSALLTNDGSFKQTNTADIYLPAPPFTAASLHFCLGWIYAGHLDFSNRSFDLNTAFDIHRAAAYLQLEDLQNEVEARIVHDFCHGLEWAVCHCRDCTKRIARVWKFAKAPDVGSKGLERRAKAFLVQGWAETWGREVGLADAAERQEILDGVLAQVNADSLVRTYRSLDTVRSKTEMGLRVKGHSASTWTDPLGRMLDTIEARARHVLVADFEAVASGSDLSGLLAGHGFSSDVLEKILSELIIALGDAARTIEAPRIYQTIVSSILLRVDSDTLQPVLAARSRERQMVETTKEGVLAHIRRRWMRLRDEGGFAGVENWAMKEISDEIDVPLGELRSPITSQGTSKTAERRALSSQGSMASSRRGLTRTTSRMTTLSQAAQTPPREPASRPTSLRQAPSEPFSPPEAGGLRRLRLASNSSLTSNGSARSARSVVAPVAGASDRAGLIERAVPESRTIPLGAARQRTVSSATASTTASTAASVASASPAAQGESSATARRRAEPKAPVAGNRGEFLIQGSGSRTSLRSPPATAPTAPTGPLTTRPKNRPTITVAAPRGPEDKKKPVPPKTPTRLMASTAASRARTTSASTTASVRSTATTATAGVKMPPVPKTPAFVRPGTVRAAVNRLGAAGSVPLPPKTPTTARASAAATETSTARTRTTSTATAASLRSKSSAVSLGGHNGRIAGRAAAHAPPVPTVQSPSPSPSKANTTATGSLSAAIIQKPEPAGKRYLHPGVRRPTSPVQPAAWSRFTERSASSSTDETEAVTPFLSQSLIFDPPVRRESSDTSSYPPSPPKKARTTLQAPARPPASSHTSARTIRKVSSSSTRSASSFRHPALAFDPPKRIEVQTLPLPEQQITDGSTAFGGPCVRLNVGIPCIVLMSPARWPDQAQGVKRARFRANVKYIGPLAGKRGPWVGVELDQPDEDDLDRFCLDSGAQEGWHYFHLSPSETWDEAVAERLEEAAVRQRRVQMIQEGLGRSPKASMGLGFGLGLGLGLDADNAFLSPALDVGRERRPTSPLPSMLGQQGQGLGSGFERPRAMFVRPSEVVFVLGAE